MLKKFVVKALTLSAFFAFTFVNPQQVFATDAKDFQVICIASPDGIRYGATGNCDGDGSSTPLQGLTIIDVDFEDSTIGEFTDSQCYCSYSCQIVATGGSHPAAPSGGSKLHLFELRTNDDVNCGIPNGKFRTELRDPNNQLDGAKENQAQWYFYLPSGWDPANTKNHFIAQVHGGDEVDGGDSPSAVIWVHCDTAACSSYTMGSFIAYKNGTAQANVSAGSWSISAGSWILVRWQYKSSFTGDGVWRVWNDNVLKAEITNQNVGLTDSNGQYAKFGIYPGTTEPSNTITTYIDDVEITEVN